MTDTAPETAPAGRLVNPETMQYAWKWSTEAVKAALEHAGVPPKLNLQAMLSAALAVDGPLLTARVFEVAVGERVRELDADPFILDVSTVTSVELSGQFLLMLLSGRVDLLAPRVKHIDQTGQEVPAGDPSQVPLPLGAINGTEAAEGNEAPA